MTQDREIIKLLMHALEQAPHKHRIDFQAYWDWWDGQREPVLDMARDMLKDPKESKK